MTGPAATDPPGTGASDGLAIGPPGPADPAAEVWQLFLRAHALVRHQLGERLARLRRVPLTELEVLLLLQAAPDGRLRMAALADHVRLSRSGLTRRIERLERLGLVVRQACPNDARGAFAVVTDVGRAQSREAAQDYWDGVRACFSAPLATTTGLEPLRRGLEALVQAAESQITAGAGVCAPEDAEPGSAPAPAAPPAGR